MFSYFAFVFLTVGIAIPHKVRNVLLSVHSVQSIEYKNVFYLHIEEIGINVTSIDSQTSQ